MDGSMRGMERSCSQIDAHGPVAEQAAVPAGAAGAAASGGAAVIAGVPVGDHVQRRLRRSCQAMRRMRQWLLDYDTSGTVSDLSQGVRGQPDT